MDLSLILFSVSILSITIYFILSPILLIKKGRYTIGLVNKVIWDNEVDMELIEITYIVNIKEYKFRFANKESNKIGDKILVIYMPFIPSIGNILTQYKIPFDLESPKEGWTEIPNFLISNNSNEFH